MTEQPAAEDERAPDEQAAPAVSGEGAPPARTGVAAADAAADRLGELGQAPLEDHVEIYEDVHRRLQEGLADLDEQ